VCYPNSLAEGYGIKILIIFLWGVVFDSIRHIFMAKMNPFKVEPYINAIERIKEIIYWTRAIEKSGKIENKSDILDLGDVHYISATIPYPTDKAASQINCSTMAYFCLVKFLHLF